jgi:hypothetical protein
MTAGDGCRAAGGSVAGYGAADPSFYPMWAKAEELWILIFQHPIGSEGTFNRSPELKLVRARQLSPARGRRRHRSLYRHRNRRRQLWDPNPTDFPLVAERPES